MEETSFNDFKLRCELTGHEDDVRGICVCGNAGIATSSRDRTVRFWSLDGGKFAESKILLGHTSFVVPLAWIAPNEEYLEGGIVSGGMDTLVIVWDLRTGEKVLTLKGHRQQVTGIALDNGDIVSSSIDCSIRRWRNGQVTEFWDAHNAAIQSVIKLPSGELVTGSSDASLKLWRGKTCVKTFSGHTDTVRALSAMSDVGVLSASHDGSVRLWALSGQTLMEMVGHTSIVYSVDSHASGLIVSGSEDRSAKIWKDGICVQSIEHPGCVWDAKFLVNGDIVTACSDGVVRVWTADQERIAEPQELESYASRLSQYKLKRKKVGGLKLEELPGLEALEIPGTSDGQTKVVREGDNGVAYSWNSKAYNWDKIGEVVDGPNEGWKKPVLDGAEYDYVFDVDIGDGEPIRKLPYNLSDDPYATADKWLIKENLPLVYRQQVVDFIFQNSGKKNFIFDSSFRDPYTGSSAYMPGHGESSNASVVSRKPTFKHIPKKGVLVFDVAQFDGILRKIVEFNTALLADSEKKNHALPELEVSRLGAIVKILKDTSHYHSSKFADADVVLLLKLLRSWPYESLFPVIDMLRMIILHPDGAMLLLKLVGSNDVLLELIQKVTTGPVIPANLLTTIRLIANLFKNSSYCNWLLEHRSEILDAFSSCYSSPNKAIQLSFSTLILNYAVLLIEKKDLDGQAQVLSAALEIAEEENLEVDSKFRALVAIGSLMLEGGDVKRTALDFDVESIARKAKSSKDAKVAEVGADIELLTKER